MAHMPNPCGDASVRDLLAKTRRGYAKRGALPREPAAHRDPAGPARSCTYCVIRRRTRRVSCGRRTPIAVQAMDAWPAASGNSGALFRRVRRGGHLRLRPRPPACTDGALANTPVSRVHGVKRGERSKLLVRGRAEAPMLHDGINYTGCARALQAHPSRTPHAAAKGSRRPDSAHADGAAARSTCPTNPRR